MAENRVLLLKTRLIMLVLRQRHRESVAETKWDTFGLENSYLAHGQSVRVAECETDLAYFRKFSFAESDEVTDGFCLSSRA